MQLLPSSQGWMLQSLSEGESALYTLFSTRFRTTDTKRTEPSGTRSQGQNPTSRKTSSLNRGITIMHKSAFTPDNAKNTSARAPEEIYASHGQALVAEDLDRLAANFA